MYCMQLHVSSSCKGYKEINLKFSYEETDSQRKGIRRIATFKKILSKDVMCYSGNGTLHASEQFFMQRL